MVDGIGAVENAEQVACNGVWRDWGQCVGDVLCDGVEVGKSAGRWRRRERILPRLGRRDVRAEAPGDRADVARGQLVPRMRKLPIENLGFRSKFVNDLLVRSSGVHRERDVRSHHHRRLRASRRARRQRLRAITHTPLVPAAWALVHLPLMIDEQLKILIVPMGRSGGPRPFEAAGKGVGALAAAALAGPRVCRVLFGRGPRAVWAGAVRLAEGVAAADERDRLGVVHRHAAERVADLTGRARGVGRAHRALGVKVDEPDGS
mmetsp:Transcript_35065/g.67420  ORF Transcript_35065/g.67420 Transcript_35065/m.67420 type:complete len:262 (+) Transcript_35065:900-1685(+)